MDTPCLEQILPQNNDEMLNDDPFAPCPECGSIPSLWPGAIKREDLVTVAQEKVKQLGPENERLLKAMDNKSISDEEYEALHNKYYMNLGEQLALRKITEWAAEHVKAQER